MTIEFESPPTSLSSTMTEKQPAPWPSLFPVLWLGLQLAVLALIIIVADQQSLSLLWTTAMGQKMLLIAGIMFALNVAVYWPLSRWLLRRGLASRNPASWWVGLAALTVGCLFFLVLPSVYTLLIGPSAIKIQQQLTVE
jgi:hypothetical protein